ncbi:MAG: tyrosine-type recombinase/integrase [Ktedonobacteraceae bacterium]|nr:tyrosine-type recombinase/integrase [Ktedonobacteraceae bacterium]
MDEAVVATIQAQQQDIREQWGDACQHLFPSPWSHLHPFKAGTFSRILNEWACDKQIRDQSGNLYHFQSHQFRHTVGMQLINEDVPLDVISRLFGHGSSDMSRHACNEHKNTSIMIRGRKSFRHLLPINWHSRSEQEEGKISWYIDAINSNRQRKTFCFSWALPLA